MAGSAAFDEYVAWYDWARGASGADAIACHAAATAATQALAASRSDRDEAEKAAQRAMSDHALQGEIRVSYGPRHRYVEWFLWARDNLRLPDERCHEAAAVALRALDAGGTIRDAAEATTRLILPPLTSPTSQAPGNVAEPGGRDLHALREELSASSHSPSTQSASAPAPPEVDNRMAPATDARRTSLPVMILFCPLLLAFALVATAVTWLAKVMPSQRRADVNLLDAFATTIDEDETAEARPVHGNPAGTATLTQAASVALSTDRPAIAAMITHRASLRREAAVVATLLDLAARGHVRIVMESAGLRCRSAQAPSTERLLPFEQHLLRHVINRLTADGAPAQALLPDYQDDDGNQFFKDFESAVMEQAHRLDIVISTRRTVRWSLQKGPRVNTSAAGRAAARRWLEIRNGLLTTFPPPQLPSPGASVDDPLLAWAVALDTAPNVLYAMLPAGVWSSMGGHWRLVRVTSFTIWGGSSKTSAPWWSLWRPKSDQWRTLTGRVIRRGTESGYTDYGGSYTIYFLAVDDGVSEEAPVWRVNPARYSSCPLGSDVRITVDHKQRLVDITTDLGSSTPRAH